MWMNHRLFKLTAETFYQRKARAYTSPHLITNEPKETMTADATPRPSAAVKRLTPINLRDVAARLEVSLQELADAAGGLGKSTMHGVVSANAWPTRRAVDRSGIKDLMRDRGATDAEIETLFDPVIKPTKPAKAPKPSKPSQSTEEEIMLMGKQTLTPAARKAFSLFTNPFDGDVTSEAEMFLSPEIRFVREACLATANSGAFVAIVGESGAGKTTILGDLKDRIQSSNKTVIMIEPSVLGMRENDASGIKASDILYAGVSSLDSTAKVAQTTEGRTRQFLRLLEESARAGNNHMLVIEEAHSLPTPTLTHLKRLHERSRIGRRPALGILLLSHPELLLRLNKRNHALREVFQRCEIIQLQPLDGDLAAYLTHRAKLAGKELSEIITDDGVAEIRARLMIERRANSGNGVELVSLVYPLAVNNLMVACLNVAADLGAPVIDKDVVRAA